MSSRNKEIYIVGASGFVGRNLTTKLADTYDVITLSRGNPNIPNTTWAPFDITKPHEAKHINLTDKTVINCAGFASEDGGARDYRANDHGPRNLIEKIGAGKLIHISSSSIYNLRNHSLNTPETSYSYKNYGSVGYYDQSKNLGEYLLMQGVERAENNLRVISLRPHGVYGRDDTTLLPRVMERVKWQQKGKRGFMLLPGRGEREHSLTHIDNLVQAIELSLAYEQEQQFEAFNITDEGKIMLADAITMYMEREYPGLKSLIFASPKIDILNTLARHFPNKISEYQIAQLGYHRTYDISKAKKLLGYKPTPFQVL